MRNQINSLIKVSLITFLVFVESLGSCGNSESKEQNSYDIKNDTESVKIGDQEWMIHNLDISKFRNGDLIPEARTNEEWITAGQEGKPVWCYYENNSKNGKIYGKLYNWYAINDKRGLAPEGWHIPNDIEWTTLINYLGGKHVAGTGTKMKSTSRWNQNGNGTNESGFSGPPGGFRFGNDGKFLALGVYGYWWSSTERDANSANNLILFYDRSDVVEDGGEKDTGFSVRCIKN